MASLRTHTTLSGHNSEPWYEWRHLRGLPCPRTPACCASWVPLRRAVSVLAVTGCGMIAARLSREVSLAVQVLCRLCGVVRPLGLSPRGRTMPHDLCRLCCCGVRRWLRLVGMGSGSLPRAGVSPSPVGLRPPPAAHSLALGWSSHQRSIRHRWL